MSSIFNRIVRRGVPNQSVMVLLRDSSTGAPKTGISATGTTAFYAKRGFDAATAITVVNGDPEDPHTPGMLSEIDSTNMPGIYNFDLPFAVSEYGGLAESVVVGLKNSAIEPVYLELPLHDQKDFFKYVSGTSRVDAIPEE